MSVSGKTELDYLIPELWASEMYDELRNNLAMAPVFERKYEGIIRQMGDTVKVQQIAAPTGEILTDDKQTFSAEQMVVSQFSIVANKRAVASFEFTDLADLQSMAFQSEAQKALLYAVSKQIENDVISALVPSASAPDHTVAPASAGTLAAADVADLRTLLSVAKVPSINRWLFLSPSYFGDLLKSTNFISSDFIPNGSPVSSAQFTSPLYGFRVVEHDLLSTDTGYAVHPSALQMVMQQGLRLKISDLHAQNKFGYLLSADIVYGLSLFDNKRIAKISG
jgi:hypothetical protein